MYLCQNVHVVYLVYMSIITLSISFCTIIFFNYSLFALECPIALKVYFASLGLIAFDIDNNISLICTSYGNSIDRNASYVTYTQNTQIAHSTGIKQLVLMYLYQYTLTSVKPHTSLYNNGVNTITVMNYSMMPLCNDASL